MAPTPKTSADLRARLAADYPAIPASILDIVMSVFEQDPTFVKELARDLTKKERRGRAAQQPAKAEPLKPEVKSVKIETFADFVAKNPEVFAEVYHPDGWPKLNLEMVEENVAPTCKVQEC